MSGIKSGYTPCACRDCFDVAVSDDMAHPDLCNECEDAGCDRDGDSECCRPDAYGMDDTSDMDDSNDRGD